MTVLEQGQVPRPPTVTIFAPSKREIEEKQTITLVCLANNFIPDHVSITWHKYDTEITNWVKTEEFSKYDNNTKSYSLTSRLRVYKQEWLDSQNQYQCRVKFYLNDTVDVYERIIHGGGCDTVKVLYQSSSYLGNVVYILLICKSTLYGVFVMSLMLKGKRMQ